MASGELFKITSEFNELVMNEAYKKYFAVKGKAYTPILRWVGLIVCTVLAVVLAVLKIYLGAVLMALLALVAAYTLFVSLPLFVKRYIKNDKTGTLKGEKVAVVKEDAITVTSNGKAVRYLMKDITGAWPTKNLFLLETSKGLLLILEKKGFSKGTPEEFREFLVEQLPQEAAKPLVVK